MSKRSEIIYILENLHFLLESGLPMTNCLDILAKRNNNARILKIKEKILQGKTFREAFLFSFNFKIPHIVDMFIQIGESCGNLGGMLLKAVEVDKQIRNVQNSFIGAISYPLFISVVAILMILLTMIGIVPKLLPMFRDLHVNLPIYTRFFIFASNFIVHFGIYVFLAIIAMLSFFIYLFKRSQKFRISFESLILNTWGIKSLYVEYHSSIIALSVSEYLRAGFAFHTALKMVCDSTHSFAYKNACASISDNLQNGSSLSEAFIVHKKIMPEWHDLLDLASQTGRLTEQFERFYLENVAHLEKTNILIKKWSEPALMLFIGGIIAVFAVSIISPIYSVVQNVRI